MPHRRLVAAAAAAELLLQFAIVATGNYAWINFIAAVPCLAAFDDDMLSCLPHLRRWLPPPTAATSHPPHPSRSSRLCRGLLRCTRRLSLGLLVAFIAVKSAAPLRELTNPSPWLHVCVRPLPLLLAPAAALLALPLPLAFLAAFRTRVARACTGTFVDQRCSCLHWHFCRPALLVLALALL
jgi:hypothetical protein